MKTGLGWCLLVGLLATLPAAGQGKDGFEKIGSVEFLDNTATAFVQSAVKDAGFSFGKWSYNVTTKQLSFVAEYRGKEPYRGRSVTINYYDGDDTRLGSRLPLTELFRIAPGEKVQVKVNVTSPEKVQSVKLALSP